MIRPIVRDLLALLLGLAGTVAYLTGVVIVLTTLGPGPGMLLLTGPVAVASAVRLGRYDPAASSAPPDRAS